MSKFLNVPSLYKASSTSKDSVFAATPPLFSPIDYKGGTPVETDRVSVTEPGLYDDSYYFRIGEDNQSNYVSVESTVNHESPMPLNHAEADLHPGTPWFKRRANSGHPGY
jgi:hypothetical protein